MDLKYINCVKTGCLSTFFDICQAHIAVGEENTIKLNVSVSDDDSHECSYQVMILQNIGCFCTTAASKLEHLLGREFSISLLFYQENFLSKKSVS